MKTNKRTIITGAILVGILAAIWAVSTRLPYPQLIVHDPAFLHNSADNRSALPILVGDQPGGINGLNGNIDADGTITCYPGNWAQLPLMYYQTMTGIQIEGWNCHFLSAHHKYRIAHTAWPQPLSASQKFMNRWSLIATRTWRESLILLPPECTDVDTAKGKANPDPLWNYVVLNRSTTGCVVHKSFIMLEVPPYSLPMTDKPFNLRKITDVEFSTDERDIVFDYKGKRYQLRLPRWGK